MCLEEGILLEATKSSGKTKYKCQFCSFRGTKEELVEHVEEKHPEMIPQNYTAARTVFNYLNKKEFGTCIVCHKETEWREDLWRYDRVHPECKQEYTSYMRSNMKKVYGKENLLDDPEQQEKMLKNRKISGVYKFKDGGSLDYVGSYEKKTLEFLDKVMNVKSADLTSPGPIIEYEYKGKKHFWITDLYYIPMNLVIEIKDGGSNPNNREMIDYRAKQIEKEKSIKKANKYNYLRLTDNNFEQLLFILAEIKSEMMDSKNEGNPKYISHVNETGAGGPVGMAMAPAGAHDSCILIPYNNPKNNVWDLAIKKVEDKEVYIYDPDEDKVIKESMEYIQKRSCGMYKYKCPMTMENWGKITNPNYNDRAFPRTKSFFYKKLTGRELLDPDQLNYDSDFKKVKEENEDGQKKEIIK